MKNYSFVFMSDNKFVMPTTVAICSLIANKSEKSLYDIHLILDDVEKDNCERIVELKRKDVNIILHKVDALKYDELSRHILTPDIKVSRTDMLKFELANYLSDIDMILYLDGDLVINKCIEPIFETNLNNMYLAAADDMGDTTDENGVSYCARRIDRPEIRYFNAGVMLLNLKEMRKDDICSKLWDYRQNGINYFMSQDALNVVTYGKRISLPLRYNFITSKTDTLSFEMINKTYFDGFYSDMESCINDQVILHMAGRMKPWKYYLPWFTDIFKRYYDSSPYSNEKLNLLSPIFESGLEKKKEIDLYRWKVFTDNILPNEAVVLYGAGVRGKWIYEKNVETRYCDIVLWADKNPDDKRGICSPDSIKDINYRKVVIAVSSEKAVTEIKESLVKIGVAGDKILVIG